MGEIADMMLEGDLCAGCGVALECEGFGILILCHDCHSDSQYKITCNQVAPNGAYCEKFYNV